MRRICGHFPAFSAGTIAADSPDAVNVTTSLVLGASLDSEAEEWWLDINNEVKLEYKVPHGTVREAQTLCTTPRRLVTTPV